MTVTPTKKEKKDARVEKAGGLRVTRRFSKPGDPFAGIEFVLRTSKIRNADGSTNFESDAVEVPAGWDQTAVDILVSKYFRRAGVPVVGEDGTITLGRETSAKQWSLRLANAWQLWGDRGGYFASPEDSEAFRDEMVAMLLRQMASPNSPQHFNTGLFEAYAIEAPAEGNWYVDPADLVTKLSAHRYERSAASACYIQSVADQLVGEGSIFEFLQNEARLFKSGSGSGANFSDIRGLGEALSGGGTSSGVMSFLRVADRGAGSIKSGGTTRRAAKMVILNADHPEIEIFIASKMREEDKVRALVAAGYSADWNGEAYDTVSFQNGNHTVRLPRGFMQRVERDGMWQLTARTTGAVLKELRARDLWDQIALAAWTVADPGVQFDDILNDWNTAANDAALRGTNPCSEFTHVDNTSCNLASLNLVSFFDTEAQKFDVEAYLHAVRLLTMVLEITVSMSHYPSELIAKNSYEHRPVGLGYANIGALLMRSGLAYDSDEGRSVAGALTALMHDTAYATSAELARAVGPCMAWERNRAPMSKVVRNHARAAFGTRLGETALGEYEQLTVRPQGIDHGALQHSGFGYLSKPVMDAAYAMLRGIDTGGYRNMQVTVLAPTGTIGLQMGCDTTGVEPDFALVKHKKLAGGGYFKIVNGSVVPALKALGYSAGAIDRIITHALGTQSLDGSVAVNRERLLAAGLPEIAIERAERQLGLVTALEQAFAVYTVGEDVVASLGIAPEVYGAEGFSLLRHLGFTQAEIDQDSALACGHQTLEGAADLKSEHLAVFDTANRCGDGTRSIAWSGHIRMLGTVAPHLSGAASKTVNLDNSATVEDVKAAYEMCYALGVKAAAVYRDGSKLSQVLSGGSKIATEELDPEDVVRSSIRTMTEAIAPGESPAAFYRGMTPPKFRLPDMRLGRTWKLDVGGTEVFVRTGEYADGTLGELFLDLSKEGSTLKGILSCFAISVSHGLQYGVPLAKLVDTFTFHNFAPQGIVRGHANLKMATSIVDAVFKVLALHYLERVDLVQVAPEPRPVEVAAPRRVVADVAPAPVDAALIPRFSGEACSQCGGQMVRTGTCSTCTNCATTSGCS